MTPGYVAIQDNNAWALMKEMKSNCHLKKWVKIVE